MYVDPVCALARQKKGHSFHSIAEIYMYGMTSGSLTSDGPKLMGTSVRYRWRNLEAKAIRQNAQCRRPQIVCAASVHPMVMLGLSRRPTSRVAEVSSSIAAEQGSDTMTV